jgi:two-component system CheB/CheR fusion protein
MQMLLERRGYAINIAQSVRSALDMLSANDFDLLISDIGLPDGTGIDLLNTLTREGRSIKAIALSGYGMEEDIQRSRNAGFFEHLTKPVSIKRLQEVIEELARR